MSKQNPATPVDRKTALTHKIEKAREVLVRRQDKPQNDVGRRKAVKRIKRGQRALAKLAFAEKKRSEGAKKKS